MVRLAAPLQAWGSSSRFTRRMTDRAPTKSGVIGLLAAAQGLRRTDPLEDLLSLSFGVRIDQPGQIERDFQTARTAEGKSFPLTNRYYIADGVFLAAVSGEDDLISTLDDALRHPRFPLFLGRRSCPPVGPVTLGTRPIGLWEALTQEPWQASTWWRVKQQENVSVEVRIDSTSMSDDEDHVTLMTTADAPVSFDPESRQWGWRQVSSCHITISNPDSRQKKSANSRWSHDPMAALEVE
jgi:CRISPR system Cascade subunit CasD